MEVLAIHAHPHALELAGQLVKYGARARVGKQIAEQILAVMLEICGPGIAGQIVLPPFPRIDQNGVSFAYFLETLGSIRDSGITIGMPLDCQPPVRLS